MNWELTIRPVEAPQRGACAWFVPGEAAADWLAALAELPIDPSRARLLIVPQSQTDRRPLGALIVQIPPTAGKVTTAPHPAFGDSRETRFICGYGCLAGRLFFPVEAVLKPPATENELKELLADDQLYVWHPAAGLVPYGPADCLRPADLLAAPAESPSQWDRAVPGVAYNTRLLSLSAAVTPSLEQMIEKARDEIGSQSHDLKLLPPSPNEPKPGPLAKLKQAATTRVARFALWLSKFGAGSGQAAEGASAAAQQFARSLRRAVLLLFAAAAGLFMVALIVAIIASAISLLRGNAGTGLGQAVPEWLLVLIALCALLPILFLIGRRFKFTISPEAWNVLRVVSIVVAINFVVRLSESKSLSDAAKAIVVFVVIALIVGLLLAMVFRRPPGAGRQPSRAPPAPPQPAKPARPGWLARLGAWAAGKLQQTRESIDSARHREIERLVHLLDADPDAGLKFALPLAGDVWRGVGAPGAQLTSRTVEFDAAGQRGGAGDPWQIREDYRRKLTQQYRTLANREMSLGRHRRAAYILGQLLGDWTGAAKTLVDGGHYREAAVVYDERLKRPLEAAGCLENGGLLSEAIVIYERLDQHEKVGDLYTQLEQPDEATRAFRRAVEAKRSASDRLGAAKVLETKLQAPDEAWDELVGGWPAAPQAEGCLREAFDWTARYAEFDRAKQLLRAAAGRSQSPEAAVQFAHRAAAVATEYSEPTVRAAAVESVLAVASPRLPRAKDAELSGLTTALRRLSPDDRLLSRDCDRFVRERAERDKVLSGLIGKAATKLSPGAAGQPLQLQRELKLPLDNVRACVASGDTFYAAGWRGQELVLIRGNWAGTVQYPDGAPWKYPAADEQTPILMALAPIEEEILLVHPLGQPPADYRRTFPPTDQLPRPVRSGAMADLGRTSIALTAGGTIQNLCLTHDGLVVRAYNAADLSLIETLSCDVEALADFQSFDPLPMPYVVREGVHYIRSGAIVYQLNYGQPTPLFECHDVVLRLIASPPHTRPRLIAAFERGAEIFSGVTSGSPSTLFAQDMIRPHVLIHRDGWIIAADRAGCDVFTVTQQSFQLHATLKWPDRGQVVALLPMPTPHGFAVAFDSGQIVQFQINRT